MKKITLLCCLLAFVTGWAQFSKTHYIPPVSGSDNPASSALDQYLYISTPSATPINFKIIQLGGATILGTVSKSSPYVHVIGSGTSTQLHTSKSFVNSIRSDKGYVIEADDMVYVSVRLIAGNGNHAGGLVSKGMAALGTTFRIGSLNNIDVDLASYGTNHYTFVSVLATENNTLVQFEDIRPGVELINNAAAGSTPSWVTLNAGESFVMAVEGPHDPNRDGLIGSMVVSDKPIAVNCGSFAGSNANTNLDLGFDQIVPVERTGTEYIFIKSTGQPVTERVLLVAHEDNTDVFLEGNTSPAYFLNAGDYVQLDGSEYNANGNLYVQTSKKVFAYQSVGDNSRPDFANQKMFFVPPLNCETPHVIDNIPLIDKIGSRTFIGRVTLVTQVGSTLNFNINGIDYPLLSLNFLPGVFVDGPTNVVGNTSYETYTITGISGNVGVYSTGQLYLASYGSDDAATFGGFYSGFAYKPEISFVPLDLTQQSCIPNVSLSVNTLTAFDVFQWYFNGTEISGATAGNYNPTQPGYYYVKATIAACGTTLISDEIPISSCPTDADGDGVNDNIDRDYDNDGIANCTESYGDVAVDLSTASTPVAIGTYNNPHVQTITFGGVDQTGHAFAGSNSEPGQFSSTVTAGKGNSVTAEIQFNQPLSLAMAYAATGTAGFELTSDSEFILKTAPDKTITVLNPGNQLRIDTNYDGIYESGVTSYSSFEIRFQMNQASLAFGSGNFSFNVYRSGTLIYTHKNLSDVQAANATFALAATCVPNDSDGDTTPDQLDGDSDNDGILDNIEAQGQNFIAATAADGNKDGLSDVYGAGILPVDTDADGVPDYRDLDSDNDGIYDLTESQSGVPDVNGNGMADGPHSNNGIADALETFPDSGIVSYILPDADADGRNDYIERDSDNDGCTDVIEAGYQDPDGDGVFGTGTPVVNARGLVTGAGSYVPPVNNNYVIAAPLAIATQPVSASTCATGGATLAVVSSPDPADRYQWQMLQSGSWVNLSDNAVYSGTTNAALQISGTTVTMDGSRYRVRIDRTGNSCGLISDEVVLTVNPLPVIVPVVNLVQCDVDGVANAITEVNLRQKEFFISADAASLTFRYFTSETAAQNLDVLFEIASPTTYVTADTTVWVRVSTIYGCFGVARLNVRVTATNITGLARTFRTCDDFLDTNGNDNANNDDTDGIATFDFSSITADILALLPSTSGYSIKYYRNASEAAAETDSAGNALEIVDISNYRNIGYPGTQSIWVRIESDIDNACFGLGPYVTLVVDPLPDIPPAGERLICLNLNQIVITLDPGLPPGTNPADFTYAWTFGGNPVAGAASPTLDVNTPGVYTVTVTSLFGCARTQIITVNSSDLAHLDGITVVDLADINSISVNVSGTGHYVFALGQPNVFQDSPVFSDVLSGIHDLYIKDLNGCGTVGPIQINVLGIPKYFTPNGDGFNDTWNLRGADATHQRNAVIRIFDRYGKLLKQISPIGDGWDGTYNEKPAIADDYWFTIELEGGRMAKGHFSLKR